MKPIIFVYKGDICPVNQRYCKSGVLSRRYRESFSQINLLALSHKNKHSITTTPKKSHLKCKIEISWPTWHDIDSMLKVILDGCQGVFYQNDNQIYELVVKKCKGPKGFTLCLEVL